MTAVPPRPAVCEVCRCGLPRGTAVHGNPFGAGHAYDPAPAAPDATAGDGLREALIEDVKTALDAAYQYSSYRWPQQQDCHRIADELLGGPALRDVLAAAARDAERVARVRELAEDYEGYVIDRGRPTPGTYDHGLNMAQAAAATDLRRALDPS